MAERGHKGCYVSNEFPCFELDRERIVPRFLWLYFSRESAWLEALGLSSGSTPTSRNRLKEDQFLQMEIPLPPIGEQRRIVARIEELAALIKEAQGLRAKAREEAGRLYRSVLAATLNPPGGTWQKETVTDVIISMDAGWSPRCERYPANGDEWGVLKTTSVQWCQFHPEENKRLREDLEPRPDLCVEAGDVLVTRAGPRKRVGVVAAVRESWPSLMISDKLIRLRSNLAKVDSLFLELALASPFSQEYFFQRKTGLADAQVNISQKILRATPVAYPPLPEQRRIVAYLDDLQTQVDELTALQDATQAELDALLPSVLDRAFRGEL